MKKSLNLIPLFLLAGCGGGGGTKSAPPTSESLTVRVVWPAREARFVPAAANSLAVVVSQPDGTVVRTLPVPRPVAGGRQDTVLDGLPYANLSVSIKAYPTTDGTGNVQAASTVPVAKGAKRLVVANLDSTVDHLAVSGASTVLTGGTSTFVATAYDASGAVVLLKADAGGEETLDWASDDPRAAVAAKGASAVVTGAANGAANVKATFRPDGGAAISATREVTVSDALYKPNVVVLAANDARKATLDGATLTVTGDVSDIAVGTVVLSSQGKGLTRKVTAVNGAGAFATTGATVEDAILACDKTLSIPMDAAETAYVPYESGVTNASGSAGDLKMTFANFDVSRTYTPGLILNGTFSVKIGVTVHLKVEGGKITRYETTVRHQGAADLRITPKKAAGAYALYGTPYIGMLAGEWAGRSHELLPGVALTPRVEVRVMPGYNDKFYNGLSLRLQTSNDATIALRYAGGAWTSDGAQTSNIDASLAPTTFPRNTVHFGAPAPETIMALNGLDSTALDSGVWPSATTSDVAGPPAGVRLVVDATYGAFARAYNIGFLYNGPQGADYVTRNFDLQPAANGVVDKTLPKNTGGGDVTIQ